MLLTFNKEYNDEKIKHFQVLNLEPSVLKQTEPFSPIHVVLMCTIIVLLTLLCLLAENCPNHKN